MYHPQANGLVERFHRQLKDVLRVRLAGVQWVEHLPWVLLGLRTQPKELVYGNPLTLPGEFLSTPAIIIVMAPRLNTAQKNTRALTNKFYLINPTWDWFHPRRSWTASDLQLQVSTPFQ